MVDIERPDGVIVRRKESGMKTNGRWGSYEFSSLVHATKYAKHALAENSGDAAQLRRELGYLRDAIRAFKKAHPAAPPDTLHDAVATQHAIEAQLAGSARANPRTASKTWTIKLTKNGKPAGTVTGYGSYAAAAADAQVLADRLHPGGLARIVEVGGTRRARKNPKVRGGGFHLERADPRWTGQKFIKSYGTRAAAEKAAKKWINYEYTPVDLVEYRLGSIVARHSFVPDGWAETNPATAAITFEQLRKVVPVNWKVTPAHLKHYADLVAAYHGGGYPAVDQLAHMFWPDMSGSGAFHGVQVVVHKLIPGSSPPPEIGGWHKKNPRNRAPRVPPVLAQTHLLQPQRRNPNLPAGWRASSEKQYADTTEGAGALIRGFGARLGLVDNFTWRDSAYHGPNGAMILVEYDAHGKPRAFHAHRHGTAYGSHKTLAKAFDALNQASGPKKNPREVLKWWPYLTRPGKDGRVAYGPFDTQAEAKQKKAELLAMFPGSSVEMLRHGPW